MSFPARSLWGHTRAAVTERALMMRILLTVAVVGAMRALSHVPAPGVMEDISAGQLTAVLGGLQMMGSANTDVVSIVALGVGPLVMAMIVCQVAGRVVPALRQMRERPGGEKDMARVTRRVAIALAAVQAVSLSFTLRGEGLIEDGVAGLVVCVVSLVAGAMLVGWFADRITRSGIGDGVSLLIGAGVVAVIWSNIEGWWETGVVSVVVGGVVLLAMATAVVLLMLTQRRFPVLVANSRARLPEGASSYLPVVALMAGVMPAIFAGAVMNTPQVISGWLPGAAEAASVIAPGTWGGVLFEALLVGAFSLAYLPMVFDPWKVADGMSNRGVFLPGVTPGDPTAEVIAVETERFARRGAVALSLLVVVPGTLSMVVPGAPALPMGTSVIILAGVGLALAQRVGVDAKLAFMNRHADREHRALEALSRSGASPAR